jgi:4-amino-4-deoxy-L-arabinose transferase-like glycosyltransferase
VRRRLFILALLVRLAAILATGPNAVHFGDGLDYIDTARALCDTHAYPARGSLPFFRAPGLAFFIAGVTVCHPSAVVVIKIALAVCDAVTVVLIADLAAVPWLAGLIAALNPFFITAVCDVRSEPPFMMLLTLAIWCLLRGREGGAGVAVGLAALTRPAALLCMPLFALYRPRRAHVLLLGAALTLAPWTIRNAARFHELIVVNDGGGFNFWRGYAPEIIAIDGMRDRDAIARASWEFDARRIAAARNVIERGAATPLARSRAWSHAALDEIRRDPALAARWTLRKAWLYWRPWLSPEQYSWPAVIGSGAFNLLLYIGAAIALARCRDRRLAIGVIVYFAASWLAHLPYQVVMRFRQPFTDPLLIALLPGAWGDGGLRSRPYTECGDADRESRSAGTARP